MRTQKQSKLLPIKIIYIIRKRFQNRNFFVDNFLKIVYNFFKNNLTRIILFYFFAVLFDENNIHNVKLKIIVNCVILKINILSQFGV